MAVRGKPGAMLAGRYRLLEQLGEGGMGSVWKAEHVVQHTHVAIKLLDPDVARLERNLGRFLREAKTLASLRSPHVVQVLDFGSDAEAPYLVMELLEGQTLGRHLARQGRLSLAETSRILNDVCAAMSLVHEQGLIHRDLKPENIFLCGNFPSGSAVAGGASSNALSDAGEPFVTKVVDFGIAKSLRGDLASSLTTRTGHMLGTPSYMSPEQCRGLRDIDHRADLWALGVIAYECLLGRVPFRGEVLGDLLLRICMDPLPVPSRQPGSLVPAAFDAWFAKAVARDREARFQSAAELAAALAALSTAAGIGGLPRSAGEARGEAAPLERLPSSPSAASVPRAAVSAQTITETTSAMGLAGVSLGGERLVRHLALGAVAVVGIIGGAWLLGSERRRLEPAHHLSALNVEVQSLRPAYEAVPRVLRPSVPSGRRLPPPRASVAAAPPSGAGGSGEPLSDAPRANAGGRSSTGGEPPGLAVPGAAAPTAPPSPGAPSWGVASPGVASPGVASPGAGSNPERRPGELRR